MKKNSGPNFKEIFEADSNTQKLTLKVLKQQNSNLYNSLTIYKKRVRDFETAESVLAQKTTALNKFIFKLFDSFQSDITSKTENQSTTGENLKKHTQKLSNINSSVKDFAQALFSIDSTLSTIIKPAQNNAKTGQTNKMECETKEDKAFLTKKISQLEEELNKIQLEDSNIKIASLVNEVNEKNIQIANLNMRLRWLYTYPFESIELIEKAPCDCTCGGAFVSVSQKFSKELNKKVSNYINEQLNLGKNGNEPHNSQAKSLGSEQIKQLQLTIDNLENEQANLLEKIQNLTIENSLTEEKMLKTKMFNLIFLQTKELMRHHSKVKNDYNRLQNEVQELEKLHFKALNEIIDVARDEKLQLQTTINSLTNENEMLKRTISQQNISSNTNENNETKKMEEEKTLRLQAELNSLSEKLNDVNSHGMRLLQYQIEIKDLADELKKLQDKYEKNKESALIQYYEARCAENVTTRHSRHKTLLKELEKLAKEKGNNIEREIQELIVYLSERDHKVHCYEKRIEKLNKKKRKEIDDLNSTITYMTSVQKSTDSLLNEIIKIKKEIQESQEKENKILREAGIEKRKSLELIARHEAKYKEASHQKDELQAKLDARDTYAKNLEEMIKKLNEDKIVKDNAIYQGKKLIETLQINIENLQQKIAGLQERDQNFEKSIKTMTIQIAKLKRKTFEDNSFKNLASDEEFSNLSHEKIKNMIIQLNYYKDIVHCKSCGRKERDVFLERCGHTFCRECIEKNVETRTRKCPSCMMKFSEAEIKSLY